MPAWPEGLYSSVLMKFACRAAIVLASQVFAYAPSAAAKDVAAACRVDADCVVVPDDCCGCTGGGKQRALSKKDQASYQRARQVHCADTMCAAVMSQDPSCAARSAVCKEGKCTLGS